MARKVNKKGDSYQVTFSLCLKQVIKEADKVRVVSISSVNNNGTMTTTKIVYDANSDNDILQRIIAALSIVIIFALTLQAIQLY